LIEYGLALLIRARPLEPLGAVLMGEALLLLLQFAHYVGRVRGVDVTAAVASSQIRYWLWLGIASIALGLGASVLALCLALPAAAAAPLAAAGAIAVLAAATGLIRRDRAGA